MYSGISKVHMKIYEEMEDVPVVTTISNQMVAKICTCLDEPQPLWTIIALSALSGSFALRTQRRVVECDDVWDRYIFLHTCSEHVQL